MGMKKGKTPVPGRKRRLRVSDVEALERRVVAMRRAGEDAYLVRTPGQVGIMKYEAGMGPGLGAASHVIYRA
jgi:hypothetical protein